MSAITHAQRDALIRAYSILGEHFDHSLIAISTASELRTEKGEEGDAIRVFWNGGYIAAVGLSIITNKILMTHSPVEGIEP
jgi:hypothetical protein